jgi:hypothetical protein
MAGTLDNGLSLEAAAVSAYNAFFWAQGLGDKPNFDHLNLDDTAQWSRLALKAEAVLGALEGKPMDVAASEVAKVWSIGKIDYKELPLKQQLCWQAVTRHLCTLIDAEEIPHLVTLEKSWGEWVETQLKRRAAQ